MYNVTAVQGIADLCSDAQRPVLHVCSEGMTRQLQQQVV